MDGWEAYLQREPFGDECLYLALLCAWTFNAHASSDTKPLTARDVMAFVESIKEELPEAPKETRQSAVNRLRSWGMSLINKR